MNATSLAHQGTASAHRPSPAIADRKAAFSAHLAALRSRPGNTTLSLRGQTLEARDIALLAEVLDEQCGLPGGLPFNTIDFTDARLHSPLPLLTVLDAHAGAGITCLDFSGAQSLADGQAQASPAEGLDEPALQAIIGFVGTSTALRSLTLDRQPALGLLPFMGRLAANQFHDLQPPLLRLLAALQGSAVETLALRGCQLSPQDWGNLDNGLRRAALKHLDLEGNDQMATASSADACLTFLVFLCSLDRHPSLETLRLPSQATSWALAGCSKLMKDHPMWPRLALPGNRRLRQVSPLMDSDDQRLAGLRQTLHRNQAQWQQDWERVRTFALCLRDAPAPQGLGLPRELKHRLVGTAIRQLHLPS
ncbi:hypothetical protein [Hydrogenophaga sp. T2]|uniref:hypothetical protein n=1 Tax=Hydrogenophaga sp. T2 TaxID=3132823 RepID=UPI003CED4085